MDTWLLRIGFGGVQEFISQARKARDLASGSQMLSLASAHLQGCAIAAGARVILPVTNAGVAQLEDRPHQSTLLVSAGTQGEIEVIGNHLRDEAVAWLTGELSKAVSLSSGVLDTAIGAVDMADLWQDVERGIECYWVARPISKAIPDRASFQELSKLFDARRFTRTFEQLSFRKSRRTCSQCGNRPSVMPKGQRGNRGRGSIGTSDQLCLSCLGRRLWSGAEHVPGTSSLARDRFWRDDTFLETRRRLGPKVAKVLIETDAADAEEVTETLAVVKKMNGGGQGIPVTEHDLSAFLKDIDRGASPYYALVAFDGDHMGQWFNGKFFDTAVAFDQSVIALGEALVLFGAGLREALPDVRARQPEAVGTRVLYSGGDDGLLLCPLDWLLATVSAIQAFWNKCMAGLPTAPTLTLHSSVVHMKEPLQPALRRLREELETTKELGRNAFSILADVRAGAGTCLRGQWGELGSLASAVEMHSTWRMADFGTGQHGRRPNDVELRNRQVGKSSTTVLSRLSRDVKVFFDPTGSRDPLLSAMDLEVSRFYARSGLQRPVPTGLVTWLNQRAGHKRFDSASAAYDAVASALAVTSFLARELDWE